MHRFALALIMSATALQSPAADIDKYAAAATVRTWVFAAQGISTKCTKAFPELTKQMSSDLAKWKQNDRIAIERAETLWKEMQVAVPRSAQDERDDQAQLEQLWLSLSEQRPGEPPNEAKSRCAKYGRDRADGVLRQRRPEVFRALEAP